MDTEKIPDSGFAERISPHIHHLLFLRNQLDNSYVGDGKADEYIMIDDLSTTAESNMRTRFQQALQAFTIHPDNVTDDQLGMLVDNWLISRRDVLALDFASHDNPAQTEWEILQGMHNRIYRSTLLLNLQAQLSAEAANNIRKLSNSSDPDTTELLNTYLLNINHAATNILRALALNPQLSENDANTLMGAAVIPLP